MRTYYDRGIPELNELALATNFTTTQLGGEAGLFAEYFAGPNLEGDPIVRRNDSHINFGEAPNADLGFG